MLEMSLVIGFWLLFVAIVHAIATNLWVKIKWRVFGWKPDILNEKQLTITVKNCSNAFLRSQFELPRQEHERLTEDDKRLMREDMESYTRYVIERYIENFLLPQP